jgi:hypothetical protein
LPIFGEFLVFSHFLPICFQKIREFVTNVFFKKIHKMAKIIPKISKQLICFFFFLGTSKLMNTDHNHDAQIQKEAPIFSNYKNLKRHHQQLLENVLKSCVIQTTFQLCHNLPCKVNMMKLCQTSKKKSTQEKEEKKNKGQGLKLMQANMSATRR